MLFYLCKRNAQHFFDHSGAFIPQNNRDVAIGIQNGVCIFENGQWVSTVTKDIFNLRQMHDENTYSVHNKVSLFSTHSVMEKKRLIRTEAFATCRVECALNSTVIRRSAMQRTSFEVNISTPVFSTLYLELKPHEFQTLLYSLISQCTKHFSPQHLSTFLFFVVKILQQVATKSSEPFFWNSTKCQRTSLFLSTMECGL